MLLIYEGSAERRHVDKAGADAYSQLMQQALELDNKLFVGVCSVRRLAAGYGIALGRYERYADSATRHQNITT